MKIPAKKLIKFKKGVSKAFLKHKMQTYTYRYACSEYYIN